ncbi:MAG: hypothetical protein KIT84_24495 [Labilithrix sp.]|nr:hypothetical protein [Labilithrix sp.]MCW5814209.1 hypothetical protein [Labilithrix sp.]
MKSRPPPRAVEHVAIPDRDTWPDSMLALSDLIGPELTLKLTDACGGVDAHIPRKPTASASHPWAEVLGETAWSKVCAAFGGERFSLPRGTRTKLQKRRVYELHSEGVSNRQIAVQLRITARYVRLLLNRAGLRQPRGQHRARHVNESG